MNPGKLSDRIVLKYPTSSSLDRFGQTTFAYASSSLWSNVKTQSGTEINSNGIIFTNATYIFTIRETANATEKAYITFEGKDYNIVFIDEPFEGYLKLTGERRKQS